MPASARSLRITDTYRERLAGLRTRALALTRQGWTQLDPADLDGSHARWVAQTVAALTVMQQAGARLSAAYLTAYLTSERQRRTVVEVDAARYGGTTRDGRPLQAGFVPTLYTVKASIGDGRPAAEALTLGLSRATRIAGEEAIAPARQALADTIQADDRIVGWRRVTSGGCLACIGAATGAVQADDELLEVHDNCQCSKEPVVAEAHETVSRDTGPELFNAMTPAEQDARYGGEKAEALRTGQVAFQDLIQRDPMAVLPDGITERPLEALDTSQ